MRFGAGEKRKSHVVFLPLFHDVFTEQCPNTLSLIARSSRKKPQMVSFLVAVIDILP